MIKIFALLLLLSSCGKPIEEEKTRKEVSTYVSGVSENILLETSMSYNFDLLPLEGKVRGSGRYWSGSSWRSSQGSINLRWNTPSKEGFGHKSPTRREVFTYPIKKMKELSPAEKYDLYMGRYDYPLKWEVDFFARGGTADWEGICHGWAGASIHHEEPNPKVVKNPDGIEIHFGSSDIKALLSYAYSKVLISINESIGKRCETEDEIEDKCNNDLEAHIFHVVLANKLGLRAQTVIADMDRYKEVWNHPLIKYESKIEKYVSITAGRKAIVKTKLTYLDVVEKNSWTPHPPVISYMTTRYELHLDEKGNILSGKWLSRERPDFLWVVQKQYKFDGYLDGVLNLVE